MVGSLRLQSHKVGTRDERSMWRMVIVMGLMVLLGLASFSTSPSVIGAVRKAQKLTNQLSSFSQTTSSGSNGRSLFSMEAAKPSKNRNPYNHRKLTDAAECFEEYEDFCGDPANVPVDQEAVDAILESGELFACLAEEDFELACCQPNLVNNATNFDDFTQEFEDAVLCVTLEGNFCPADELCVAELIPAVEVGAQCFREFELNGGVPLYVFLLMYLFLALAIVVDDYFTYSLDSLGELLGLSPDVKGATFAAIGSSAPELFVSLADNVLANPPKSVGVGTIVGSAIFNILVIIGASAITAGRMFGSLKLDWRPLTRDSLFYSISIAALIGVAVTGDNATEVEGAILVLLYLSYITFMIFNAKIFNKVDSLLGIKSAEPVEETPAEEGDPTVATLDAKETEAEQDTKNFSRQQSTQSQGQGQGHGTGGPSKRNLMTRGSTMTREKRPSLASNLGKGELIHEVDENEELEPYFSVLFWPTVKQEEGQNLSYLQRACGGGFKMWLKRLYYLFVLPINLLFRLTIPDPRYDLFCEDKNGITNRRRIGYWSEFVMCIVHIAVVSHFLVYSAAKFGCLVGIPPAVMGLTFLAAGTSVPDMITSVILTKQGEGDAAVANSIGSNVFDILIGLGLPWFIAGFVYGGSLVATGDIAIAIGFLYGVLFILIAALAVTRFKLNFGIGIFLVVLYVFYVIFELFIRPNLLGEEE